MKVLLPNVVVVFLTAIFFASRDAENHPSLVDLCLPSLAINERPWRNRTHSRFSYKERGHQSRWLQQIVGLLVIVV
jgi:hypothetical protein